MENQPKPGNETTEPRPRDKVDGALDAVEKIRAANAMADDVYHKCLVSLAYEYILVDETEVALVLLNRPGTEYYEKVQSKQMEEDELYRQLVVLLAYKLIQAGLVEGSDSLYPATMPAARA